METVVVEQPLYGAMIPQQYGIWTTVEWYNAVPLTDRVPCAHDDPPVVGVGPDGVDDLSQLVYPLSAVVRMHVHVLGPKVPPLEAIHRPEVTWVGEGCVVVNYKKPADIKFLLIHQCST